MKLTKDYITKTLRISRQVKEWWLSAYWTARPVWEPWIHQQHTNGEARSSRPIENFKKAVFITKHYMRGGRSKSLLSEGIIGYSNLAHWLWIRWGMSPGWTPKVCFMISSFYWSKCHINWRMITQGIQHPLALIPLPLDTVWWVLEADTMWDNWHNM